MQATPERPPTDAAPLACPRCGAGVEDGQLACLNCGAALRFRDRRLPDWRITAGVVAVLVLLAGTAIGVGVGTLTKDEPRPVASATPDSTTPANPPEAPAGGTTPPATTTPGDGTEPPPGEGSNAQEPVPPASGGDPTATPPAATTTTTAPGQTTTPGAAAGGSTTDDGSSTPDDSTSSDGADSGGSGDTDSATGGTARWAAGDSGFTVVLASVGERSDAQRAAREARSSGISAGVLDSDDFSSLRPGYWVAFAGRFDDVAAAERAAERYKGQGFPEAYPREVRP